MKRHEALIPLSHDHQNALARALRLRKASELDADGRREGVEAFLEFVDTRITPHFEAEEALLTRARDAADGDALGELDATLRSQHEALRARFDYLRSMLAANEEFDADELLAAGQELTDHIRFEERDLFERLQADLPDEVLRTISAPLASRDD